MWSVANAGVVTLLKNEYKEQEYSLSYTTEMIDYLNEYNKYVTEKGATFLLTFLPAIEGMDTSKMKSDLDLLQDKTDAPVISCWEEQIYPAGLFYDSQLHMNAGGAMERTNQLAVDIKKYFEQYGK